MGFIAHDTIGDPMSIFDAFKPKWQNSNPAKRLEAVEELGVDFKDTIERIATTDSDAAVRLAAVKKIDNIQLLLNISKQDADTEVKNVAKIRYFEEIVKKFKSGAEPSANEMSYIADLKNTHFIDDLLKSQNVCETVRAELVKICEKQNILCAVAMRDSSENIAIEAANKIVSDSLLQDIAKNSKQPNVRKMAAEKIRIKKEAEDGGKKAEALLESKRDALIKQAHFFAAQKEPLAVKKQFDDLMAEALKLGMADKQSVIDEIYTSFNKFCDEANAAHIAAVKAEAEKREKLLKLTASIEELETIIANGAKENSERIEALIAEISTNKDILNVSLTKRFNNAFFKVQDLNKAVEVAEEVDENSPEGARPELLERLKALADTDVSELTNKHLHAIIRDWEKLPLLEGEDPTLQEYNVLRNTLAEKIAVFNEDAQKRFEENSEKLKAIIEKIKAIDENDDFRSINKKIRELYLQWKEIVGENKFKYHDLWQEYKAVTARFQEMQQWENWHNEKDRDDLLLEMDALTKEEPSQAVLAKLKEISARWKEIGPISSAKFQEYRERFQNNYEAIKQKCAPFIEQINEERQKNFDLKQDLCQKIENLVQDSQTFWKDKYKTIQEIQESWKAIGMVPKDKFIEISERFKAAMNAFYEQHKECIKQEDSSREANYEKKVALCVEAESINESSDWNTTSGKMKQLQEAWKAIGPVPKNKSDEIWNRFRAACDTFFTKKRSHFEELDAEKQKNLEAKTAFCEKLEAMETDSNATIDSLKELDSEWKSIGMVPKESIEAINTRYNAIYNKLLERLAQTDASLAQKLDAIKVKKQNMVDKVHQLAESAGSNQNADAVREIQKEWRDMGFCGIEDLDLYKKFREACDDFFTRRRDQLDIQEQARKNNLQKKLLLCEQAEELLTDLNEQTVVSSMNKVKHLRRLWKEVGAVPREFSEQTWARFNAACDKVFAFGNQDKVAPDAIPSEADIDSAEHA